jgi:hypothetical protein
MSLESGRNLFRGSLILISVVIAYFVSLNLGLGLAAFVGVLTLQSIFTDWCPADLILRPLGLKEKLKSQKI